VWVRHGGCSLFLSFMILSSIIIIIIIIISSNYKMIINNIGYIIDCEVDIGER